MANERMTLNATLRRETGKGANRRLRAEERIPGIVYGDTEEILPVSVDPRDLKKVLETDYGFNTVFDLVVEGREPITVMIRERQFDSVRRELTHLDFFAVEQDREVSILVPVKTTGSSKGVKAGGRLQIVMREVRIRCNVRDVPPAVFHDVTELGLSDQVYIDEMAAPEGCEFVFRHRFPVIRIARKRGAKAEEEGEEVAEAAEPA